MDTDDENVGDHGAILLFGNAYIVSLKPIMYI